jgi:hypothetical protein
MDISEASFSTFDCEGIPSRLIRRDPDTQVVVKHEKIRRKGWQKKLASWNTHWPFILELRTWSPDQDFILVAPRRSKGFRKLVEGLNDLRDAGIAEPD